MTYENFCDQFGIHGLNPQQEKAMKKVDGATLLLAVPGSGKTTVIVNRSGYMLHVCGINPYNILTLTYTKAAATEMKERFLRKFGTINGACPYFATINSFCVSIMRVCARDKGIFIPKLLENNESVIRQLAIPRMPEYPSDSSIKQLAQQIGKAKNEMATWEELADIKNPDLDFQEFFRVYSLYLQDHNLMDFDDQLIMAHSLLQSYPDILARAQQKFKYISLDEAQDTSLIQHKIVEMLVGKDGNIFMVGDEDQSIYAFRGAYPHALLNFKSTYNNAEILFMETNYRSDTKIVDTSNIFIKRNAQRNDKNMHAKSTREGTIDIVYTDDMKNTPEYLMKAIKEHLSRDDRSTLAVLYRNNDSIVPTTDLLAQNGIVVRQRDAITQFLNNFLVKDILTFMAFAKDQKNIDMFFQIYYKLGLYIKKSDLDTIYMSMLSNNCDSLITAMIYLKKYGRLQYQLKTIKRVLERIPKESPEDAINDIIYGMEYWDNWLAKKVDAGASADSFKLKINMLRIVATHYKTVDSFAMGLNNLVNVASDPASRVTLSTIHSSKGLEFDEVIIIDALDTILPASSPNMTAEEEEEEARLFYVGATRAKHKLTFLVPQRCLSLKMDKSEFLHPYEVAAGKVQEVNMNTKESIANTEKKIAATQAKRGFNEGHKKMTERQIRATKMTYEQSQSQQARAALKKEQAQALVNKGTPADLSGIKEGVRVKHPTFGEGIVNGVTDTTIIVDFEKVGEKKLSSDFCARGNYLSVVS